MIYELRHLTTYRYQRAVNFTRCALRLSPADTASQHLLHNEFSVTPSPSTTGERVGAFGERVMGITVEAPHRDGPYGAKGLGEATMVPTAPAIANGVYRAVGVRIKNLPLEPEVLLDHLQV